MSNKIALKNLGYSAGSDFICRVVQEIDENNTKVYRVPLTYCMVSGKTIKEVMEEFLGKEVEIKTINKNMVEKEITHLFPKKHQKFINKLQTNNSLLFQYREYPTTKDKVFSRTFAILRRFYIMFIKTLFFLRMISKWDKTQMLDLINHIPLFLFSVRDYRSPITRAVHRSFSFLSLIYRNIHFIRHISTASFLSAKVDEKTIPLYIEKVTNLLNNKYIKNSILSHFGKPFITPTICETTFRTKYIVCWAVFFKKQTPISELMSIFKTKLKMEYDDIKDVVGSLLNEDLYDLHVEKGFIPLDLTDSSNHNVEFIDVISPDRNKINNYNLPIDEGVEIRPTTSFDEILNRGKNEEEER